MTSKTKPTLYGSQREVAALRKRLAERDAEIDRIRAPEFKFFVGPCEHGRDPWTRCDVCEEIGAGNACRNAALEEAAKAVEAFHHTIVDGLDYATSGTEDRVAIYSNRIIARAVSAVRSLKRGTAK